MPELHKIEHRILWLDMLRKSFDSDTSKIKAYKVMAKSEGGRLLTIDILEKYLKTLDETSKNQKDSNFYENRGRLKMLEWLLNTIKESAMDSKEEV